MPNIINNTSGLTFHGFQSTGGGYEIDSPEAHDNASIVYNIFVEQLGWSVNAAAALCGAMYAESNFNYGQTESGGGGGFGLLQWTPKSDLIDVLRVVYPELNWTTDARAYNGVRQCNAVIAEYQQRLYQDGITGGVNRGVEPQWYSTRGSYYGWNLPLLKWSEWAQATDIEPDDMTRQFIACYLRPAASAVAARFRVYADANAYYLDYFGGDFGQFFPFGCSKNGGDNMDVIKAIQALLKGYGLYSGDVDGVSGNLTRAALVKAGVIK